MQYFFKFFFPSWRRCTSHTQCFVHLPEPSLPLREERVCTRLLTLKRCNLHVQSCAAKNANFRSWPQPDKRTFEGGNNPFGACSLGTSAALWEVNCDPAIKAKGRVYRGDRKGTTELVSRTWVAALRLVLQCLFSSSRLSLLFFPEWSSFSELQGTNREWGLTDAIICLFCVVAMRTVCNPTPGLARR